MSYPYIKMPDGVILDDTTSTNTYGKFTIQPLERGFGVTLGNSFRRVLISSLTGAAFIAIKINNVLHEFTSIPGVLEDVSDVILNLKQVRMKVLNKNNTKIEIPLAGPISLKAGDLQKYCTDIEILNPDLHIATLNEKAKFSLELYYGFGKGYVPANEQKLPEEAIGIIPIDSIFTPIKNVRYEIENVRIGEKNDFEKLSLEIFTDGSITPQDALSGAGKMLKDHINMFINFDVEHEEEKVVNEKDAEVERLRKILTTSVDDLELSVRSHNCLKAANIKTLGDLVKRDESEMLKFRNFGRKSLAELNDIVDVYGLEFGMDVEKYLKDNKES